jgi:RNA-directed DNA polymerase
VNVGVLWPTDVVLDTTTAWARVLAMQTKLHRWATVEPGRRFDDVFNLVHDPAFLLAAWDRVRGNKGGRTAGVDGIVPRFVPAEGVTEMLTDLRQAVKTGEFAPLPVRQRLIPKANGKTRSLGIPTEAA